MTNMTIEPWISVDDTRRATDFYVRGFGAVEIERLEEDGTTLVACLAIGEARVWIQLDPETAPVVSGVPSPMRLILVVDDPDAAMDRALAAGGTLVSPVADGHGWRVGRLADPAGHHWELGKRI